MGKGDRGGSQFRGGGQRVEGLTISRQKGKGGPFFSAGEKENINS
jgi:hypothetical protein